MTTSPPPDMKVRLSATLRQKIEQAAKENNRTLNAEIAVRLEQSFVPKGMWLSKAKESSMLQMEKRLNDIETRLQALEKQ